MSFTDSLFAMQPFDLNAPCPAVDPADVQALWRFMRKVSPGWADPIDEAQGPGAEAPTMGIDVRLMARACSEGADVYAVFIRTSLLRVLLHLGMLSPWQREGELSAVVFEAAATVPIGSINGFNPDDMLANIRGASDLH